MATWPAVNASLNALNGILVVAGVRLIRRKQVTAHRACMAAACATSTVFLASYLAYHARVGSIRFTGQGWIRPVYFAILISHTLLAVAIVPLVIWTLSLTLRNRIDQHRRLARVTVPLWLYVSVTGVVVYVMLYHLT